MIDGIDHKKQRQLDQLVAAVNRSYMPTHKAMWRGFLIGVASGLGTTIGVAIVISAIGFIIRAFGGLPVIGVWLNDLGSIIQRR